MTIFRRVARIDVAVAIFIALASLAFAPTDARSAELRTEVAEVGLDGRVRLPLPAGHSVQVGDLVTISTETSIVGPRNFGARWRIESIGDGFAIAVFLGKTHAIPIGNYRSLGIRYAAVIATADEPAAPADATPAPTAPAAPAPAASAPGSLLDHYRSRAEGGDANAMLMLGLHHLGQMPLPDKTAKPEVKEGLRWLHKAAESNSAAACALAAHYGQSARSQTAVSWTRRAAAAGDPACMYRFGMMLLNGEGVAKNATDALAWLKKASDAGVIAATSALAEAHLYGTGTRADPAQALALFLQLAQKGVPSGMFMAGLVQLDANPQAGLKWLRAAAEQGHALAMYQLGTMYLLGLGVAKSEAEARNWFARGAAQGEPESTLWLATLYERGAGGSQSSREAARLALLALRGSSAYGGLVLQRPDIWSPQFWRELQMLLRQAGVYAGPLDGQFGPATVRAIEAYIKQRA